jgi:hypothetical protein
MDQMNKKTKEKDFREVVAGIRSRLKKGDMVEIAKRCNLTAKTWHTAKTRDSWNDLKGGETRIVTETIAYLKERDELKQYAQTL